MKYADDEKTWKKLYTRSHCSCVCCSEIAFGVGSGTENDVTGTEDLSHQASHAAVSCKPLFCLELHHLLIFLRA